MGMDWLKGIVAPPAQFIPPGQPVPGTWGAQPAAPPAAAPQGWSPPAGGAAPLAPPADARVAALEARCAELRGDLECVALFARTLLTLLQEKQVITPDEFQQTRQKLDMLDGKLDDR